MRRAWVVRSGSGSEGIDALRAAGLIGLRFDSVGDVRAMTPREVEHAIADAHPDQYEQLRSRLMRFVTDLRLGDLLVSPDAAAREVWFSVVTGGYEYVDEPAAPGYRHTRTVEWLGWADLHARWLSPRMRYLDVPGEVFELRDPGWWFEQLGVVELAAQRPVGHLAAARNDQLRRSEPAARAPRSPSAPRASTPRISTPKVVPPKPPEHALCAGPCGLQWRIATLVDGLCPDCRGD
jgi:hypothetical protein